ncbi:MAG: hypothetical protein RLZZ71_2107 [Bacteroidota bacterium]|jgi:hypothetical protein
MNQLEHSLYQTLLSDETRKKSERIILIIAIASFFIHLSIIFLVDLGVVKIDTGTTLFENPIAAIYTPFSFVLVYEVYLLIFYLPRSITTYIGKQYEIITLIIIRRIFKDLSALSLSPDWFSQKYDLQFTYDILASVILFFLIYLFFKQSKKRNLATEADMSKEAGTARFIRVKKLMALALVPILIVLSMYSFSTWLFGVLSPSENADVAFQNLNNVFFEQFFTVLIIVDVFLLLFSFFHTDEFHKVIRNSGFIISTILIRLSFSVTGLMNTILIVAAVVFGLLMFFIYNKFEKRLAEE